MNLSGLDLWVIGVPLFFVLGVALYMRRYTRSVADFLAANRCAGRYLICNATAETGASVMLMIAMLEVFSKTGFSLRFWESLSGVVAFFLGLFGLVVYRYRQTRSLTFHQLFEMRYSKGIRVFASFLNVLSGIINFGVQPAVGARFFVYFCGLPKECHLGGLAMPTFVPVMMVLMVLSLSFALSGGQISVMVTDCLEGAISMVFYLVIAFFIISTVSLSEVHEVLVTGTRGNSYVDPFDIGGRPDFDGWYVVVALLLSIYWYRGGFNPGFVASAKSPHESRMAGVLGSWRSHITIALQSLVAIAAFTVLHHPHFAAQQGEVERSVLHIGSDQLAIQMRMPIALGAFFTTGIKGAFCAVLLLGLLASQGSQLLVYGSTFLQDVVLPLRRRPFKPAAHLWALRLTILGVAVFVCLFSILFKPVDYLAMTILLIGSIYLAGIGAITWGGLYWRKGTTAGAWTALSASACFGIVFNLAQQFWVQLDAFLARVLGSGPWQGYLAAHAERFPFNGQQLAMAVVVIAGLGYIGVSLATYRRDFDLDEMLHRGKYRLPEEALAVPRTARGTWFDRFLQMDENFTSGDRRIMIGTFFWTSFWKVLALGVILWTLLIGPLSSDWWFHYMMVTNVWMTLVVGIVVTIWFYIGIAHDFVDLFRSLKKARSIDSDDGTVRGHHNAADSEFRRVEASRPEGGP